MKTIEGVKWYEDLAAKAKGEPGIWNSYIASLATALQSMGEPVDPCWLMGASGWAFRVVVHKAMCPSAMSIFNWKGILPETVEQAGYRCTYVSRLWHEDAVREQRKKEAHEAIVAAIDRKVPPIVWDIGVPEWGLITGYDNDNREYQALACTGKTVRLPYDELGEREIKILSVSIPGGPNDRPKKETVRRSLEIALRHAEQREWMNRPDYQDGIPAFDQWASAVEPGGRETANWQFSKYYAGHYYGARCYARDYLSREAGGDDRLLKASETYGGVADLLKPVWEAFAKDPKPADAVLKASAHNIREAGATEKQAVSLLKSFLST